MDCESQALMDEQQCHATVRRPLSASRERRESTVMPAVFLVRVSSPQREGRPGAGEVRFQHRRCDLQLPVSAVVRCHLAQSVGEHAIRLALCGCFCGLRSLPLILTNLMPTAMPACSAAPSTNIIQHNTI